MTADRNQRIARLLNDATMPYALARTARPYLKQTPEYEQARREKRSRAWLEAESMSLGYALAETVRARLEDLDPMAGTR